MRILKLLIPFLILQSSFLKAAENIEYEILKKTSFFSIGMNGFAGKISAGEMAYNAILKKITQKTFLFGWQKTKKPLRKPSYMLLVASSSYLIAKWIHFFYLTRKIKSPYSKVMY